MGNVKTVDLENTSGAYFAAGTLSSASPTLQVSGQVGSAKDGTVPADYESQIHLALLNLRKILIAAGARVENITKLTVYVVNYDAANRKHTRHIQKFLRGHRPAMTLVPVNKLAMPQWLFEIDATVALPPVEAPSRSPTLAAASEKHDVVIVGAGLAGLTAAHELIRAGFSCVVLEARDRVGGKTWSQELPSGAVIDLGAAWINDTNQSRIIALAGRFGADMIEQNTNGHCVLQNDKGEISLFPYGEIPRFDEESRKNIEIIRDMAERDCQALDTWNPRDTTLDSMTFEAYLRSRGASEAALATGTVWTRAMLGQDPKDISALYFLNYCKSGGGLMQMRSDRKHGGQYLRVRQGTQLFANGLASSLPADTVRLSTPVKSIVQNGEAGSILVQTSSGRVISARKVITTVPGPALRSISFYPELPHVKQLWVESLSYGYYTKAMMEFKSPFWAEAGMCGLINSFTGPAAVVRDTSAPQSNKNVLTCFMAADHGREWGALPSQAEKEAALLKQLKSLYCVNNIEDLFVSLTYYEWSGDEWSGFGCPCTALPPGLLDTVGGDSLRQPAGDLHFAGTETAGEWKGYMEGAKHIINDLILPIISEIRAVHEAKGITLQPDLADAVVIDCGFSLACVELVTRGT
ncbi:flavin containing protein [Fusarium tjaetaba]|uniref:Amine oxidase n=1 Tax=Fusarium tjaetaba TaxID=1567544 RepID=A0A8H5RIJ1_9HYPO|nr:flavin containing protein [Fusarium tjaetaba]KAF5635321.1 flavin containing protein [Fusarium tjaetaba]